MVDPLLEHCEFASWYPLFEGLVPKARILDIPDDFREYLLSDGILLFGDEASDSDSDWETLDVPKKEEISLSERHIDDQGSEKSKNNSILSPPSKFHDVIEKTIAELDGEVAPKLNWSAPVDSKWMNPSNTMRCTSANDIYLLLKSSDYINHDLQLEPNKLTLVLREWLDIQPSTEFRCFVRNRKLVGITQRDMNYYDFLKPYKKKIIALCESMAATISGRFQDSSYVFDVHIPGTWNKVWLIDINPWHEQTDSLLFAWAELPQLSELEIRLVEKDDRSRTFSSKPHSASQVPYELVNMGRGTMEELLTQMKEQRRTEQTENADDMKN